MIGEKVYILALLLCLCSSNAIPLPKNADEQQDADTTREIKVYFIITTLNINTSDVIHEDELTAENLAEPNLLKNVTLSGFKSCTGKNTLYGESLLKFTLHCPRVEVEYKSESCKRDPDETGLGICDFHYQNVTAEVDIDAVEHEKSLLVAHVSAENVTLDFQDELPPPTSTTWPLERRFRTSIFSAFLKKADFLVNIFF